MNYKDAVARMEKDSVPATQSLTILAHVHPHTGYGQHTAQTVRWLERLYPGLQIKVRPLDGAKGDSSTDSFPIDLAQKIVFSRQPEDCELIIAPLRHAPTPDRQSIYFTMTESTGMTKQAVEWLNMCSQVITPSQWNAAIFSAAGVHNPTITVIPLGVDPTIWKRTEFPKGTVTVFGAAGCLAHGAERKGLARVISGFQLAFEGREDVRLQLKVLPNERLDDSAMLGDHRITFERGFLPEADLAKWMAQCHCWINLASGGWELFVHQAMALGRPCISMFFGGQTEYFNNGSGLVVDHRLVRAGEGWPGLWAEPYEEAYIAALRYAAEDMGRLQTWFVSASLAVKDLTWENSVKQLGVALCRDGVLNAVHYDPPRPCKLSLTETIKPLQEALEVVTHPISNLTVCITAFHRPQRLLHAINSCAKACIPHVVVATMEPDEAVKKVIESIQRVRPGWLIHTHLEVDLGVNELWLQAAYRSPTNRVLILHDDDYLDAKFGERYQKVIGPAMDGGRVVTWRGLNVWDDGRTADAVYHPGPTRLLSPAILQTILLDRARLSLSPIVTVFRRDTLIAALKECAQCLTKPENFMWPEMLLGTEIVAHFRHTQQAKGWFYLNEVLSYFGTHPGSGTVRASASADELNREKHGYNLAREHCLETCISPSLVYNPRLIFVFNDYEAHSEDERRRNDYAMATWQRHFNSGDLLAVPVRNPARTSEEMGDPRPVPFFKDLADLGLRMAQPEDIIVYANRDICLTEGAVERIKMGVQNSGGVALAIRRNMVHPKYRVYRTVLNCPHDTGFDLFAFTPEWWLKHRDQMPDMLIGRECWDAVFRRLAEERNGKDIFVDDVTYHELHDSFWVKERITNPGQQYNRTLAREFFKNRVNDPNNLLRDSARHIMHLLDDRMWQGSDASVKAGKIMEALKNDN